MVLCEYVMEVAEKEAMKRLAETLDNLMCDIADEIIETAKEIEGPEWDSSQS